MNVRDVIDLYNSNEENNNHSGNYLLLARAFGDKNGINAAKAYIKLKNDFYGVKGAKYEDVENARQEAHKATNGLYQKLHKLDPEAVIDELWYVSV